MAGVFSLLPPLTLNGESMIKEVNLTTPVELEVARKDHVVYEVGDNGDYHSLESHYPATFRLSMYDPALLPGNMTLGQIVSKEWEEKYATVHFVCTHDTASGFRQSHRVMEESLDKLWSQYEDDVVRPFKVVWGQQNNQMRGIYTPKGSMVRSIAAIANSEAETVVFLPSPLEE
jgi:hypothetical protein